MPEMPNPSGFPYPATGTTTPAAPARGWGHYWRIFHMARWSLVLVLFPFVHYNTFMASQGDKDQALQLETAIHQQIARGDADAMYNNTDVAFQNAVPRARHGAYIAWITSKFGSPLDCTQTDTGVKYGLGTKMLRSRCVTRFSGGGTGIETFAWLQTENGYLLSHYDLKPQ
jgi:hypothetical protein